MDDMHATIVPRSDQLNADSLISGPITIKVTNVTVRPGMEQPVSVFYEGDDGKPYKPGKSMCRVLVKAWGDDSKAYVGKSMTLYRDESVKWGGVKVGGIRISAMTDIEGFTIALTETRKSRVPFTVAAMKVSRPARQESAGTPAADPVGSEAPDLMAALQAEHRAQVAIFAGLSGELDVAAEEANPEYISLRARLEAANRPLAIQRLDKAIAEAKARSGFPGDDPIEETQA